MICKSVVPSGVYKWSINPFTNPYPVYSHTTLTRDSIVLLLFTNPYPVYSHTTLTRDSIVLQLGLSKIRNKWLFMILYLVQRTLGAGLDKWFMSRIQFDVTVNCACQIEVVKYGAVLSWSCGTLTLLADPSHHVVKHRLAVPLSVNASQVTGRPWPISSIAEPAQPCDSDTSSHDSSPDTF
jgi:hypothetical protein